MEIWLSYITCKCNMIWGKKRWTVQTQCIFFFYLKNAPNQLTGSQNNFLKLGEYANSKPYKENPHIVSTVGAQYYYMSL